MIMRSQGFIHPATLVPDELEYNKGYEARMSKLESKFKDINEVIGDGKAIKKQQTSTATTKPKVGSKH
jgi:hypothetical protein